MTMASNKTVVVVGSLVLLASVVAAVFFAVPALAFLPLLLLSALLLLQFPTLLFYVLLASVPWSVESNITETLGTDLPDEPLMLLMAFTALILVSSQQKRNNTPFFSSPLFVLLLAGFFWSAITVVLSKQVQLSVKFLLAKTWYLLAFAVAPVILAKDEKFIKRSAIALFVSMFLATCFAVIKHASLGFTFANINDALSPFFRNHVNYSALLVFMVPLQIAMWRLTENKRTRFLLVLTFLIILPALVLSYARGAWLALVVGLTTYWLVKKGWLLQSFLLCIFVVGSLVFWLQHNDNYLRFAPHHDTTIFHTNFGEHIAATVEGKDVSTAERFYRWIAGVRMSGERWSTGFGPTTFYQHYQSYTTPAFRTWVSNNPEHSTVHNYFLLLLIEQGVAGLLFFIALVGAMFWQAQKIYCQTNSRFWKVTAASIGAILWMQCTVNFLSDLIETDKAGSVFYLCAAVLVIGSAATKQELALRKTIGTSGHTD